MLEGVAAEVEASSSATLFFPRDISTTCLLYTSPAHSCSGSEHKIVHSTHYTLIGLCLRILLISSARWLAPNTHLWKQRMIDELCLSDRKRQTLKYLCHFVFVSYSRQWQCECVLSVPYSIHEMRKDTFFLCNEDIHNQRSFHITVYSTMHTLSLLVIPAV